MEALRGQIVALYLFDIAEAIDLQERDEVLRHRVSYLAKDLVIPTWNLASIYANVQNGARWYDAILGRHYARAARQVHALFIDVNELTDRTEHALKIVGDVYAAVAILIFELVLFFMGIME